MANRNETEYFDKVKRLLQEGASEGVFPGVVLLVARSGKVLFFEAAGHASLIPAKSPMAKDTVFDLASLTKPLATTMALMKLADQGGIDLDEPLDGLLQGPLPDDKRAITPRLLLCHSAGLIDWKPFYLSLVKYPSDERKGILRNWILESPLVYRVGEDTLYSDLGFMLLERVIEVKAGMTLPEYLDKTFYGPLSLKTVFFNEGNKTLPFPDARFAATEDCPWRKKIMRGVVHDENAYAVGGYSGHAGLFGRLEEVYALVNMLREHFQGKRSDFFRPGTVRAFFRRQETCGKSTRALGWDMPSAEGSSAGRYFSEHSVGHLGFTGTSIWMDLEKDVLVILLTNRIHPTRNNEKIKAFRPRIHDAIIREII